MGRFEGVTWIKEGGRNTYLYLFAHHPIERSKHSDHRDPQQWDFYVLMARDIKAEKQKSLSLSAIRKLGA